jgi:hypothetical protein
LNADWIQQNLIFIKKPEGLEGKKLIYLMNLIISSPNTVVLRVDLYASNAFGFSYKCWVG